MNLAPTPLNLWTERYETLRRHFVENRQLLLSDPLGLTLLLWKGVAGWMRTWPDGAESPPKAVTPSPESGGPPISNLGQHELTLLIAHMTARHLYPTVGL